MFGRRSTVKLSAGGMGVERRTELRHYSASPFELDRTRVYEQKPNYKPRGLWVSVPGEDDWPTWCRSEEFGLGRLAVEHEVRLSESAKVLMLNSVAAIDRFFARYQAGLYPGEPRPEAIDWPTVATEYDGIIIAPYQWARRLGGPIWYYGWDCASGCIWNLDAIESLTVLAEQVPATGEAAE